MADLTPQSPAGRQLILGYGDGVFRVGGRAYRGSILVFPDETLEWSVAAVAVVDPGALGPILARAGRLDLLILGSGTKLVRPAPEIGRLLRSQGIALEVMDTGAACRTYNVLLAEDRRVAAALIAV